jgi:CBS domain-containing protein
MSKSYTAKDFLKTEKIISFSPQDVLSKALSALSSSHDASFILDDSGVLLGAVNPYYAQFQGRFPPETKLKRVLSMPPKLSLNSSLPEILHNMVESKIYFLPVVDASQKLLGIVSLRRVLKFLLKDAEVVHFLEKHLQPRKPHVVTKDALLSQARLLLKKGRCSRLPVVNESGTLIGLLTRFDLKGILSQPIEPHRSSLSGQKKHVLAQPVSDYMQKLVYTYPASTSIERIFDVMRLNKIGSVVLVDALNKPTGIITYRDILETILLMYQDESVSLKTDLPHDFGYISEFKTLLKEELRKLPKDFPLKRIEARLVAGKNRDQSDKWFELSISVHSARMVVSAKQRSEGWRKAMQLTFGKIVAQL